MLLPSDWQNAHRIMFVQIECEINDKKNVHTDNKKTCADYRIGNYVL